MPTDVKVEVTLGLSDGTKIVRIEDLADVTTLLEQHEEFVKVVRCKDCKHFEYAIRSNGWGECGLGVCGRGFVEDEWYCANGERGDESTMGQLNPQEPINYHIENDGTYRGGEE